MVIRRRNGWIFFYVGKLATNKTLFSDIFFIPDKRVIAYFFKPFVMNKTTLDSGFRTTTAALMPKIAILSFLLFSFGILTAQENRIDTQQLNDRDVFLSSFSASEQAENVVHLKSLLDDLQSSVYFESGVTNVYGERPNSLFTNPESLNGLANATIEKSNIEIVTIRLSRDSDVNRVIDLSVFADYPKLKYIYILSAVANNAQNISRSVRNIPNRMHVFYKIDLGS